MSAATVLSEDTGIVELPSQAGVQPPESSTKARLNSFSPEPLMIEEIEAGLLSTGMKYTGCVNGPLPGGVTEPVGEAEGEGDVLGLCEGDGEIPDGDGDGDPVPPGPFSARSSA